MSGIYVFHLQFSASLVATLQGSQGADNNFLDCYSKSIVLKLKVVEGEEQISRDIIIMQTSIKCDVNVVTPKVSNFLFRFGT